MWSYLPVSQLTLGPSNCWVMLQTTGYVFTTWVMHQKTELCFCNMSYVPKNRLSVHKSCRKNITRRLKHNSIIARTECNYPPWKTFEVWNYDNLCTYEFHKDPSFCCVRNRGSDLGFAKQYWLYEYFNFQCIFHMFTVSHLKSLSRWIINEWGWN